MRCFCRFSKASCIKRDQSPSLQLPAEEKWVRHRVFCPAVRCRHCARTMSLPMVLLPGTPCPCMTRGEDTACQDAVGSPGSGELWAHTNMSQAVMLGCSGAPLGDALRPGHATALTAMAVSVTLSLGEPGECSLVLRKMHF